MKKIICLFLVFITLSLCLVGCDWKNIFSQSTTTTQPKWVAPEGVVETTVTDNDGNSIVIAHSDNFTQDDLDFILMLHEGKKATAMYSPASYTLGDIIWQAQNGSPLFLMHFENPFIICAYLKPYGSDDNGGFSFDVSEYLWYKFYDSQAIPSEIGNTTLTGISYLLYDCIIEKDIVNGVDYNKHCKYYLDYHDESSLSRTFTDMIMWYDGRNIGTRNSKFLEENDTYITQYEVFVDEDNNEYLVISGEIYDSRTGEITNTAEIFLGSYYDSFYPNFVRNESLDRIEYIKNSQDYYEHRMIQVDLSLFVDLITNKN